MGDPNMEGWENPLTTLTFDTSIAKDSTSLVWYKDNNTMVGHITFSINEENDQGYIKIETIYVQEEHRRKGYGRCMVKKIQDMDLPILIDVLYDLPIPFWEAMGFIRTEPEGMEWQTN